MELGEAIRMFLIVRDYEDDKASLALFVLLLKYKCFKICLKNQLLVHY